MGEMAILTIENVTFIYPIGEVKALSNINLTVNPGDFITIVGASGSGKSTLLKLIKKDIAPHGQLSGEIKLEGKALSDYDSQSRARKIGFVFQNPHDQIVMGNVFDELVFGLENLQFDRQAIRNKIAEVTQYFGITHLLNRETDTLSGGEKQLINLAAVLALDPDILLLDEPTAQLDPIAAKRFIQTLKQLNDEFGITILLVEHRLEEVLPVTDSLVLLSQGELIFKGEIQEGLTHFAQDRDLLTYLPSLTQLYLKSQARSGLIPVTVKDGRRWLASGNFAFTKKTREPKEKAVLLEAKQLDFQYQANTDLIISNLSGKFYHNSLHTILGANGSGKSTFLKILAGIYKAHHGKLKWQKKGQSKTVSYVPQNPLLFFMQDSIGEEYDHLLAQKQVTDGQYEKWLDVFGMKDKLSKHPHDLSGGEIQRAALLGSLLVNPDVLILDEPTKGLDPVAKREIGSLLSQLLAEGRTIIIASHDLPFVAEWSDFVYFMFEGRFANENGQTTHDFFTQNQYYTTPLKKATSGILDSPLVSLDEVVFDD